ncbi:hypothetical protein EAO27_11380 [Sphingopyxis sp. YF1]|nr:hypothetical protein EAO27_11380 [Sphingopyxis sp. YF1]
MSIQPRAVTMTSAWGERTSPISGMTENDRIQPFVLPGESRGPLQQHARSVSAFWVPAFAGVRISSGD